MAYNDQSLLKWVVRSNLFVNRKAMNIVMPSKETSKESIVSCVMLKTFYCYNYQCLVICLCCSDISETLWHSNFFL